MISNLAKETVAEFKAEGLDPSFEDIIRLNALGLKVERTDGSDRSADLAALPRLAFLGDYVLQEPTVGKRIWMDLASVILGGSYFSLLCLCSYAMYEDADKLPSLKDAKKLRRAVDKFRDEVLIRFTPSEIEAAVDYALRGNDPEYGEEAEPTVEEKKVREIPDCALSAARALLTHSATFGIQEAVAKGVTCRQLEKMIAVAAMVKGADVAKGEHGKATADFYRTADAIHDRLVKEKNHGE